MAEYKRPTWADTWMGVALLMGQRSRCVMAQVGAVIVNQDQRIVATGYNGSASNYGPAVLGTDCSSWCPRARGEVPRNGLYDACPAIHAEANAIAYVDRSAIKGGTIYVTRSCCMTCAKLISNSGIGRVVMRIIEDDLHRDPDAVMSYLQQCSISVKAIKE